MQTFLMKFLIGNVCMILISFQSLSAQNNPDESLYDVTVQLKWKHQFQFGGYYAAIEKGYYREEGLQVELLEAVEGEEPAEMVFDGRADFGITTSDILILRSEGKDAVLLASIFQHSAQILVASTESQIKNVHELYGKRIALEPHAADIITYMNDEGIFLGDVIQYPHSFNVNSLISGEVDAMTAYISDEPFLLREQGVGYSIIDPSMGGIDFYGDVLFTTEKFIQNQPEVVDKFLRATLRGWNYAMHNPEEIINLIYAKYSTRHSLDHLRFEANQMHRLILPEVVEIGYSNPGRWQTILEIYQQQNMLAGPVTLGGFFYSDYLPRGSEIPWKLILIFTSILLVVTSALLFYYKTARQLKLEGEKRRRVQESLKESERQLKASNAAKDKFFSILAHDLRNPFSGIIGLSDLMIVDAREQQKNTWVDNLQIIKETSVHISDLLNNLLVWSQAQVGDILYRPELFDLREIIQNNISVMRGHSSQKNISIHIKVNDNSQIFADKNMMNTILLNLLTNSVKFTERGGEIEVGMEQKESETIVYVRDSGIGISSDEVDRLFKIEEKFTSKGTGSERGTGLGLLICKEFIERHNGSIWVESEKGKGSTFRFSLPRFKTI